jgi:hypothetical protein
MDKIQLAGFDQGLMDLLAMGSCPIAPGFPPSAHPVHMHAQWLAPDTHRKVG